MCRSMEADSSSNHCKITVKAETEDNEHVESKHLVEKGTALKVLVKEWATRYHVPVHAVGLEDATGAVINLDMTPLELHWESTAEVHAVPVDEDYMEGKAPGGKENQQISSGTNPPKANRQISSDTTSPKAKRSRVQKSGLPQTTQVHHDSSPKVSAEISQLSTSPSVSAASPVNVGVPSLAQVNQLTEASGSAARMSTKQPTATVPSMPQGRVAGGGGALPGYDEPIIFVQKNPKRPGTESAQRFDKYKAAKTITQALALGACKGDIKNDWDKGYFSRQGK